MLQTNVKRLNHDSENQFIVGCSQTVLTGAEVESLACLLRYKSLNWDYILKIAARNAVAPLVSRNLIEKFGDFLPLDIKDKVVASFQEHAQHNMSLTGTLLSLLVRFRAEEIPVLAFKGPMLALQYYGDVSLRLFSDLDILVQPEHLEKAITLLGENGYEPISGVSWLNKKDWYLSRRKDVLFVGKENKVVVELHWKLSGTHFALPIEMNHLWKNAETVNLGGSEVGTFSFNHLLIYLCLHGSRHGWERLGWICDLNELLRSKENIDWEQISSEAKRLGCENALNFGLFLVHAFFGKSFPLPDWEKTASNRNYNEIARQIRSSLFSEDYAALKIGERYSYHLKLKEKIWDRCKLHLHYNLWYLKIIFSPNEADEGLFHLPPRFAPLYYIIRPPRLIYTYLLKPKKIKK